MMPLPHGLELMNEYRKARGRLQWAAKNRHFVAPGPILQRQASEMTQSLARDARAALRSVAAKQ
jgi:hypothetical protein